MNEKTKRVFNGWLALSVTERDAFEKAIKEYNSGTSDKQKQLRESTRDSIQKMQTGPLDQTCACCGR